uniref:Uncharacterized protein n=1 Tax=Spongospora subterranea TaxID=70186 RepID=A0A0H5QZY5_9EUKA|eukprot:CRZ07541.1 hypothetical protein [Spongospora subterranea]
MNQARKTEDRPGNSGKLKSQMPNECIDLTVRTKKKEENELQREIRNGLHPTCVMEIYSKTYKFKDVLGIGNCALEAIRTTGLIPNTSVQRLITDICQYARNPQQGRTIAQAILNYAGSLPNQDDLSLDVYLDIMQRDCQWAGLFELTIASFMLKINIIIISHSTKPFSTNIRKWIDNSAS